MVTFFTASFWMWVPLLTILPMLPLMCYYDLKYRLIPDAIIDGIYIVNAPVFGFMYVFGPYGLEEILITALMVGILYVIMRFGEKYFHGDDFLLMAAICAFCVVNPMSPNSGMPGVATFVLLPAVSFVFFALLLVINVFKSKEKPMALQEIILMETPRGFPFVIPIALSFIIALIPR